jgi:hypothetical protein
MIWNMFEENDSFEDFGFEELELNSKKTRIKSQG